MAIGDNADMAARIRRCCRRGSENRTRWSDALVAAAAVVLAFAYSLFAYAKAQTRIRTASGIWLDIVAQDFFGTRIVRAAGQNDDSFRSIILANLLRPQATRQAISDVIEALTGFAPRSSSRSAQWTAAPMASAMAAMGALGPMDRSPFPPKHFWLRIAHGSRASQRAGYGASSAGYGVGSQAEYASLDMLGARVTDGQIYDAIAQSKAVGVTIWTRIRNHRGEDDITVNTLPFTINGQPINLA
jgi:hypothetical protein